MQDWDRLAPIALPREQPVPQAIDGLGFAGTSLRQEGDHGALRLGHRHAVQEGGVDQRSVALPGRVRHVTASHDADDRKIECQGKRVVSCVMGGDRHDGPGAVAAQHVVRNPDGQARPIGRVDDKGAGEDPGLLAVGVGPFGLAKSLDASHIAVHDHALPRCHDASQQRVFGRNDTVGGAEQRIRPRGEHDQLTAAGGEWEADFSPLGAADPVALHRLHALGPIQRLQVVQQAVGIGSDP